MFVDSKNIGPPSGTLRYTTPLLGYHRSLIMAAIRSGVSFKVVSYVKVSTQGDSKFVADSEI